MAGVPREGKALLDAISGPESRGNYDIIYGGGRFSDYSKHPGQYVTIKSGPNKGQKSSAAGRYQFLERTWNHYAPIAGVSDFGPASQDAVGWTLAQEVYNDKTGRDLLKDLQAGDLSRVPSALAGTWTSLPGGIEQGIGNNAFLAAYNKALAAGVPPQTAAQMLQQTYGNTGGPALGYVPNGSVPPPRPRPEGVAQGMGTIMADGRISKPEQAWLNAVKNSGSLPSPMHTWDSLMRSYGAPGPVRPGAVLPPTGAPPVPKPASGGAILGYAPGAQRNSTGGLTFVQGPNGTMALPFGANATWASILGGYRPQTVMAPAKPPAQGNGFLGGIMAGLGNVANTVGGAVQNAGNAVGNVAMNAIDANKRAIIGHLIDREIAKVFVRPDPNIANVGAGIPAANGMTYAPNSAGGFTNLRTGYQSVGGLSPRESVMSRAERTASAANDTTDYTDWGNRDW